MKYYDAELGTLINRQQSDRNPPPRPKPTQQTISHPHNQSLLGPLATPPPTSLQPDPTSPHPRPPQHSQSQIKNDWQTAKGQPKLRNLHWSRLQPLREGIRSEEISISMVDICNTYKNRRNRPIDRTGHPLLQINSSPAQ